MTKENFYEFVISNYNSYEDSLSIEIIENSVKVIIDKKSNTFSIEGGIECDHNRIYDLNKMENWSVLILLLKLFKKGYSKNVMHLEKSWQLGHSDSGYLDLMLTNPKNNNIYMIEVKSKKELNKYTSTSKPKNIKQLLSYAFQEKNTKLISYYSFDFENKTDVFYNIYLEDLLGESANVEDLFDRWNKTFDRDDFIDNNNIFKIYPQIIKYEELRSIDEDTTKRLYSQFITILRLNSVSDKPNAFNKMINLFLAKIVDENDGNQKFSIKDSAGSKHSVNGLMFQYIPNLDNPESFMKRLNELYKKGMEKYLNKEIIDYSDDQVSQILNSSDEEIWEMVDNLRLKKNNNFSFIEVYDDDTFKENFLIVRDIVKLFQNQQFKYDYKQQFLGDFFENLLNTSLKQEAGQFFTPYPLVDFIVESLPIKNILEKKLESKDKEFIPSLIDYACGAGHFLISAMEQVQKHINEYDISNLNSSLQRKMRMFKEHAFEWVNNNNVVGIEKDYRLAKTTKIATFLNGDGEAEIISGDGINKFSSKEYLNTILYTKKNKLNYFDLLVSNPPYSIDGFMYNFQKNNILPNDGTFSLLNKYNFNDAMIETFFVERAEQLLKDGGFASIVLPQSVLSLDKYENLRNFIFQNFKIHAMLLTSDITFLGTSTSPVTLFLEKIKIENYDYETMLIFSDKYFNISEKKSKEEAFLGYKFSSDRNKSGTKNLENSKLKEISSILNSFLTNGSKEKIPFSLKNNIKWKKITDISIKTTEGVQIFPKYDPEINGKTLSELNVVVNPETNIDKEGLKYVEISNIIKNKITPSSKNKSGNVCLKNDILISSLVPTKEKIAIADNSYIVSSAIHIIRINDSSLRNIIFEELKKDYVLNQMHTLLEGFKLTYSKIKAEKLKNFVKFNI